MFDYSIVNEFLSSNFAGRAFSFLHGSHAKGTARADSDVDLIVIFESNGISPSRKIVCHGNYTYDVIVMSLETLKAYLDNAHSNYNYRVAFMLDSAVTLPAGCVAADALITQARQLLRDMRRPPTSDGFRLYFTSLLSDIRHASSRSERSFLMVDAYRCIAEFAVRWHGRRDGRKHAFETIQRFEPSLLAELDAVFTTALCVDKSTQFVLFAERFLERIGGPLREGYRD